MIPESWVERSSRGEHLPGDTWVLNRTQNLWEQFIWYVCMYVLYMNVVYVGMMEELVIQIFKIICRKQ